MSERDLDDLLDRIVAEYSDQVQAGKTPRHGAVLERVPREARPGLERCLKMIDAGLVQGPSPTRKLAPGVEFGRYRLLREIGRGGMALVWLARDTELERPVALKILRPGLAFEARHVDRFRREALAVAKLSHPNIVTIHDVGSADGYHYLAMEYVEGPSLATVLEALPDKRSTKADALIRASGIPALVQRDETFEQVLARLFASVAHALQTAHELGLVHRDVKPSNILLKKDGTPVVADFGLAKGEEDPALSLTGDTLGTPYYMSPEQAWLSDARIDHRTDVYSLGVSFYEALSGRRPFEGKTALEVFEAIKTSVPPSVRSVAPTTSKDADALIRRAMAHRPEDRYETARALAEDFEQVAQGAPTQARANQGSWLRRVRTELSFLRSGRPLEYKSARTFLGLPLVHIVRRRRPGEPLRIAKGWYASGEIAIGGIATGGIALGGIALGGLAAGLLFSWGGLALALGVAFGGMALGVVGIGGIAGGALAFGGMAFGYAAIGGLARGVYAIGGDASGRYVVTEGREDPEAVAFFEQDWLGMFDWLLQAARGDG